MTTQVLIRWVIGFIATNVIVIAALLVRAIVKWTRVQIAIEQIATDLKESVEHQNEVHQEIYREMREDRSVTNKRLRYLEETLWKGRAS